MNESRAHIYYGDHGLTSVLKISGALRFDQCGPLEKFLKEYTFAQPLLVDLSETTLLDSTALGLLAQIALKVQKNAQHKPDLFCVDYDLKQVLLSMSLDQLFNFIDQLPFTSEDLPEVIIQPETQETKTTRALAAHKTLMDLSKENEEEFKTVVDLLEESLRRGEKF